ncbi:MAG: hypothetical protein GY715_05535 [Planctomycetes bacterium]|nr:hypothetical protein [Planctomycetota bacterium]
MKRTPISLIGATFALSALLAGGHVQANDFCDAPDHVEVPSVTFGGTLGAIEDPEAGPACGPPITTGGVWYTVTGTGNTITATTCPSDPVQPGSADFDTRISIYCGPCEALNCIVGADGGCGFFSQTTVSWCSELDAEYRIFVHGSEQGLFDLSVYDDGTPCADPPDCAPAVLGACCLPGPDCIDSTESVCLDAGGVYVAEGMTCGEIDCLDLVPANDGCENATVVAVPSTTDGSTILANDDQVDFCPPVFTGGVPGVWYLVEGTGNKITVTTCSGDPVQPGAADYDTVLTVYCGDCNTSTCCKPQPLNEGGCDDLECQDAVCELDPFCCDVWWDPICVRQATFLCPTVCAPVFCVGSNDDACDASFLQSTFNWCSEAGRSYWVLVNGAGSTGEFTLSVYDDGQACDEPPICERCEFECPATDHVENEPNCGIPEDIVNGGCNSPIGFTSDCCTPNEGPGCDDLICQFAVCEIAPYCCAEGWDAGCAQLAIDICSVCDGLVYPMEPILPGESYCSTVGATNDRRDVDWYKLQLDEDAFVEMTVTAPFSPIFGIVDNFGIDSCEGLSVFVAMAVPLACETTTVGAYLNAGTWYMLLAPARFEFLPCQTEYQLSVTATKPGGCCFGGGVCFDRDEEDCFVEGGVYLGPGADCFGDDGDVVSYTSMPDVEIPDANPNGVTDTIVISESMPIGKLTVDTVIPHGWISELTITLTHVESGTSATLFRQVCEGAVNLDATFDDDGLDIECGYPATTGIIAPLEVNGSRLAAFQGIDTAGSWKLHVEDRVLFEIGRLEAWTLNIHTGAPVPCELPTGRCCIPCPGDCADGDGTVGMADLAAMLDQWGSTGSCSSDGEPIGFRHILELLGSWGSCPPCSTGSSLDCSALGGDWLQGSDCSVPCD